MLGMSHAAIYLQTLISRTDLFKTQKELAEVAGMNPSSVFAAMKASTHVSPATLEKILNVLPAKEKDELLANAIRDSLPAAYWNKVLSDNGIEPIFVSPQELPGAVEALFALLRLKALTEKNVLHMLETIAAMFGFGRR